MYILMQFMIQLVQVRANLEITSEMDLEENPIFWG